MSNHIGRAEHRNSATPTDSISDSEIDWISSENHETALQYQSFEPPADLIPYLYGSYFLAGTFPKPDFKLLPNGIAAAAFYRDRPDTAGFSARPNGNGTFKNGWIHGVYTKPAYHTADRADGFGIRFQPIGVHAIFGIDMRTLANQFLELKDALPKRFLSDIDQLFDTAHTQNGHDAIYQALRDQIRNQDCDPLETWLLEFYMEIWESRGSVVLAEAYERTGRSTKYVNSRFQKAVGLTPKVFGRILRLDALLEALDSSTQINWAEHAQDFGFYDQSHFNRDFKEFSGLTPSEYLHWRRHGPMPVPKGELRSIVAEGDDL
jgi:AraC-like DNA-binding protein